MWCRIIQLRNKGQRLPERLWSTPIDGDLTLRSWDGKTNIHKRTIRLAELWNVSNLEVYRNVLIRPISDPEIVDVVGGSFLLRGIELDTHREQDGQEIFEYVQVWHCTPLFSQPKSHVPAGARPATTEHAT